MTEHERAGTHSVPVNVNKRLWLYGTLIWLALFAVGVAGSLHPAPCGPFPDWRSSPYRLPYAVGTAHLVSQGNCSTGGHRGAYRYGYDFVVPVGTTVCAAREGVVAEIEDRYANGDNTVGHENWVKIRHADGRLTAYSHLSPHSAFVRIGERVIAGQPLGRSGNTGNTGGLPHLHFHLCACSEPVECGTLPVTFRNTRPNPNGPQADQEYRALP